MNKHRNCRRNVKRMLQTVSHKLYCLSLYGDCPTAKATRTVLRKIKRAQNAVYDLQRTWAAQ
jgi:hypothetical protein